MKIKRIIYTILLVIWMVVIFLFSNQDGSTSKSTSDKVASNIVDTAIVITKQEVTKKEKNDFIEDTRLLIRKSAHFFLYFVLGILAYLTFTSYGISKTVLFTILFCFIYACSDEVHQLYSDGRSFKLLDIFIDTLGSSIGIIILNFINKKCFNRLN